MSIIKWTTKHNKGVNFRVLGKRGRIPEIQAATSEKSKSSTREMGERKNKIKESRKRTLSHILETFKISLRLQRNVQKHAHIKYHSLPQNPPHLTILEGNVQAKLLGLEFQITQVLCQSTKSVKIGARILMANSFSWSSFIYKLWMIKWLTTMLLCS